MQYFLVLGSTPDLSKWELEQLGWSVEEVLPGLVSLESETPATELLSRLGGIVKVLAVKQVVAETDEVSAISQLKQYFIDHQIKKFNVVNLVEEFSLTNSSLKDELNVSGLRYLDGQKWGLGAAVLLHQQHITELMLLKWQDQIYLAETEAVQDIDDWTKRDRSKPYADRKKGMLPPKVARIMVNVALGNVNAKAGQKPLIYDPFCGTGTVLAEALLSGAQVVGSDLDQTAVRGASENLHWLVANYQLTPDFKIFKADVSGKEVATQLGGKVVDAIVTEPFLGKQTPQLSQLPGIFKGLGRLYLGAFKNWSKVLKNGAHIVIVFPKVETAKKTYNLDDLIDKLGELGYTTASGPVTYARAKAQVQREIYLFEYNQ